MAVDYAVLKKGGFMRQKQKNHFSLRLSVVGGQVTAEQLVAITEVAKKFGRGYIHPCRRRRKPRRLRAEGANHHGVPGSGRVPERMY